MTYNILTLDLFIYANRKLALLGASWMFPAKY